jgi:3-oxoacyl-[acyl-carrier protein] reductase
VGDAKVALVTGAARGIGRAIARRAYQDGYHIVINYRNSQQEAEGLLSELQGETRSIVVQADISVPAGADKLKDVVWREFGRLDVLVNNAGATFAAPWQDVTPEIWRSTLDTNLSGAFSCIRAFAPMLVEAKGSIVTIGSTYGDIGVAQIAAYSAAKAGVVALTRAFAKELAPDVRVNAVAPGNIDTEMTRAAGDELVRQVIEQTPLDRLGRSDEIADAVSFMISERASFITGHVLVVDGGHGLR